MKKTFAAGFLALALLLTGCGGSQANTTNKAAVTEEKQVQPQKEKTPEEKAKEEEERKAAEERQQKAKEAAENKRQEEIALANQKKAEKQARIESLLNEGVYIDYVVEKLSNAKYQVSGTTNLPDGMQIMVSLDSRSPVGEALGIPYDEGGLTQGQFKELMANSYVGQSKLNVRDGKFATVFTGEKLTSGEYEVIISSPMNSIQSTEIQSILGDKGTNLFGMGVVEDNQGKRIHLEERTYLP